MNRNKVINSFCSRKRWGEVLCLVLLFLYPASLHADEGMWMLGNLNKETRKAMKELALQYEASVAERRCGQFRRILLGSSRFRGWPGIYQSSLRVQQHTTT